MDLAQKLTDLVRSGLFPNLVAFLTQIFATIILLYILKRLVWKPMQEFLEKRSSVIVDELESAKRAHQDAEQMKIEYQTDLKNAKEEANSIIENARAQALETKEQIIKEAQKEAEYKIDKASKEILLERARVEKELKAQVIDIAFTAAEKLIHENIDDNKNRQLIDEFIKEVE